MTTENRPDRYRRLTAFEKEATDAEAVNARGSFLERMGGDERQMMLARLVRWMIGLRYGEIVS